MIKMHNIHQNFKLSNKYESYRWIFSQGEIYAELSEVPDPTQNEVVPAKAIIKNWKTRYWFTEYLVKEFRQIFSLNYPENCFQWDQYHIHTITYPTLIVHRCSSFNWVEFLRDIVISYHVLIYSFDKKPKFDNLPSFRCTCYRFVLVLIAAHKLLGKNVN